MGCLQVGRSYFDFKAVEERDIRRWEKEVGAFSVDFNQVYQRLMIDLKTIHPSIVKRVIESEFSQQFYQIISENDFFKVREEEGDSFVYDFNKVIALVFLMSAPGVIANKFVYYSDKAYYLFLRSKSNEEDDLSVALTKSEQLINLVSCLSQVACEGETGSFFKLKHMDEKGLIKELMGKNEEITKFIIEDLFSIKGQKVESLSFKELKDKFGSDNYFFSSGYFREKAFQCIQSLSDKQK
mmetsp:Transcript_41759/g.43763  ORF Transcript_41759/g.43763 Transcript_41759/m.43763 type:complete len:240 (-) Transcript_41759:91-810(-)